MSATRPAHPFVFLALNIPFGATTGYVVVTLAYLLSHAGVSVAAVAGMVAISLLPQTWKVLWAPVVDTTLTTKRWYLIAALLTAATLLPIGFLPMSNAMLAAINALVFVNSLATTFMAMATETLMARATGMAEKGRAGGWYQAGNLGGQGIGGGVALWLAQHTGVAWLPGAFMAGLCAACCIGLWFAPDGEAPLRNPRYWQSLRGVIGDVWTVARSRAGFLALLICFLPIGSGAAQGLWSAVAGDWHASADIVALVNGVLGGVVSAIGCVIGGYWSDRMDRKFAYALFGIFLSVGALVMAAMARNPAMFITFTLVYAFVQGLNYASFSAVVLEAIGGGAAATKYNLYASLSNMPIAWLTIVDGWAYGRWHANGLLVADALAGILGVAFFTLVVVASRPRPSVEQA